MIDKEEIRKNAEKEHKRLSDLYRENPFCFEKEKRRLIREVIDSAPEYMQEDLKEFQKKIDEELKKGGRQNRFAVIQSLFWNHFFDVWKPTFDELKSEE